MPSGLHTVLASHKALLAKGMRESDERCARSLVSANVFQICEWAGRKVTKQWEWGQQRGQRVGRMTHCQPPKCVCARRVHYAPQQWIIKAACGANKSRAILRASYARTNSKKQTHVKNTHFLSRTDKQRLWSDCCDIHTMSFLPINILVSVNKSARECDLPVCFLFVERAEH